MTRKDYKMIAECIKAELDTLSSDDDRRIIYWLHKRLADALKADNSEFSRDQFELACGFTDWK